MSKSSLIIPLVLFLTNLFSNKFVSCSICGDALSMESCKSPMFEFERLKADNSQSFFKNLDQLLAHLDQPDFERLNENWLYENEKEQENLISYLDPENFFERESLNLFIFKIAMSDLIGKIKKESKEPLSPFPVCKFFLDRNVLEEALREVPDQSLISSIELIYNNLSKTRFISQKSEKLSKLSLLISFLKETNFKTKKSLFGQISNLVEKAELTEVYSNYLQSINIHRSENDLKLPFRISEELRSSLKGLTTFNEDEFTQLFNSCLNPFRFLLIIDYRNQILVKNLNKDVSISYLGSLENKLTQEPFNLSNLELRSLIKFNKSIILDFDTSSKIYNLDEIYLLMLTNKLGFSGLTHLKLKLRNYLQIMVSKELIFRNMILDILKFMEKERSNYNKKLSESDSNKLLPEPPYLRKLVNQFKSDNKELIKAKEKLFNMIDSKEFIKDNELLFTRIEALIELIFKLKKDKHSFLEGIPQLEKILNPRFESTPNFSGSYALKECIDFLKDLQEILEGKFISDRINLDVYYRDGDLITKLALSITHLFSNSSNKAFNNSHLLMVPHKHKDLNNHLRTYGLTGFKILETPSTDDICHRHIRKSDNGRLPYSVISLYTATFLNNHPNIFYNSKMVEKLNSETEANHFKSFIFDIFDQPEAYVKSCFIKRPDLETYKYLIYFFSRSFFWFYHICRKEKLEANFGPIAS